MVTCPVGLGPEIDRADEGQAATVNYRPELILEEHCILECFHGGVN
jgi:hypothetical protein